MERQDSLDLAMHEMFASSQEEDYAVYKVTMRVVVLLKKNCFLI